MDSITIIIWLAVGIFVVFLICIYIVVWFFWFTNLDIEESLERPRIKRKNIYFDEIITDVKLYQRDDEGELR